MNMVLIEKQYQILEGTNLGIMIDFYLQVMKI
jgi:hypothetical protein